MEFPCVVLWRPEALDCRVLIPPEAWNWLTRNPPSLGFKTETSCILADPSADWAVGPYVSRWGIIFTMSNHMMHYTVITIQPYRRRKVFCLESLLHAPWIPVSMLALSFTAGGVMNLHVEDGVSERTRHWNGDTKGHSIIYAEYFPPTVSRHVSGLA